MALILIVLLLAVLLGAAGFAIHLLWILALIVLAIWVIGFLFRAAEGAGGSRRRWYRW
jgi:hypothetical protein